MEIADCFDGATFAVERLTSFLRNLQLNHNVSRCRHTGLMIVELSIADLRDCDTLGALGQPLLAFKEHRDGLSDLIVADGDRCSPVRAPAAPSAIVVPARSHLAQT
jgi:hypothetical protein